MNVEGLGSENLHHEPVLEIVRQAFGQEVPGEVKERLRKSLLRFRERLNDHPYVQDSRHTCPSRRMLRPLLLASCGLAAACLSVAVVFLIPERPGTRPASPAGFSSKTKNPQEGAANSRPMAAAYPVGTEVAEDEIVWWATTDERVVAVWKDGAAACWDTRNAQQVSQFKIDQFDLRNFRCLVSPRKPQLVVVDITTQNVKGALAKSIRIYDLAAGKLLRTLRAAGYPHPTLPGELRPFSTLSAQNVTQDGRYLLGASALDKLVFAIELENGKTAWCFRNENISVGADNVLFAPDGKVVLVVTPLPNMPEPFAFKRCIAHSSEGHRLWEWSTGKENAWLLVDKSAGQGDKTVLVLSEVVRDPNRGDSISRCVALGAAGKELWQHDDNLVLALSPDGTPLLHHQSANVPINAGPIGMAFTGDGSRLLKLPNLSTDWVEQRQGDRRIVWFRRANNLLLVTDAKTGEILRKITLVKPTD